MYKIILAFLLLPVMVNGQKFFNKNDIAVICLQVAGGAADGTNEAIKFHHLGKGNRFFDYNTSWKNKYKDFDKGDTRAAFPLSKTALVFVTDGYHLTRFIRNQCNYVTIAISLNEKNDFKGMVKRFAIALVSNRIGFFCTYELFYK